MSATTTLNGHARYKDQLKLLRAETAASWLAIVVERLFGDSIPANAVVKDESTTRPRYYGAFHV